MGSIEPNPTVLRTLDRLAANEPEGIYCAHPVSSDLSQGWKNITYADIANGINRLAFWLQENVASSSGPETLAYIGANDVRYVAFSFACMRLRNSVGFSIHVYRGIHEKLTSL